MLGGSHELLTHLATLARFLSKAALVFVVRHCIIGFINLAVTVLLGMGLISLARRLGLISPRSFLRGKLFILLAALAKGAFYLVLGDDRGVVDKVLISPGIQMPNPREVLFLIPQTYYSIWRPTSITYEVTILFCGVALCFFLFRIFALQRAMRRIEVLVRLSDVQPPVQLTQALEQAAHAIELPASIPLPRLVLIDLPSPTPMLLGLKSSYMILPPKLIAILTPEEVEMILRHELAHLKRHDNRWRWLLKWVEDVGRANLISGYVGSWIIDQQEALCDTLAVTSPKEAMWLSRSLQKACDLIEDSGHSSASSYVIPALLGDHWQHGWRYKGFIFRLTNLSLIANDLAGASRKPEDKFRSIPRRFWDGTVSLIMRILRTVLLLVFWIILVLVLYAKFRLLFNIHDR